METLSRDEIFILGGNESDFDLVEDCSSDEELFGEDTELDLKAELLELLKSDSKSSGSSIQIEEPEETPKKPISKPIVEQKESSAKKNEKLLFDINENWHSIQLPDLAPVEKRPSGDLIAKQFQAAEKIYQQQVEIFQKCITF